MGAVNPPLSKNMKIYCTTDTHFGHKMLVVNNYRPDNFEQDILFNIRKTQGDLLIHCGDFCIGNDENWISCFMDVSKGFKKKILVRGNHDKKSDSWYLKRGFDFVCESFSCSYFGKKIIFTHAPVFQPLISFRFAEINIHGHTHGDEYRVNSQADHNLRNIDIAPELNDYKLVNLQDLI